MLNRHKIKAIPVSGSNLSTRRRASIGGAVALLCITAGAHAATITVNSAADNTTAGDARCTLREAIANVNAAADTTSGDCTAGTGTGDTILFNLTLPATITLARLADPLTISTDVTVSGPTSGQLAIDGGYSQEVFVVTAGTVSITSLTIQNGNGATGAGRVGGIDIGKGVSATLTDCTLNDNYNDGYGGGIFIDAGGTATLTNCTLNRNSVDGFAGGIYVGGTATLTDCTLNDNGTDGGFGGGIFVDSGGTARLTNCTLSANYADSGGGVFVSGGTATLTNCTLSGNSTIYSAGAGGGIFVNGGAATLTNCTLSRNSMDPDGSAVDGIAADAGGTATLTNTIVANGPDEGRNCRSTVLSGGHNLDSDGTCFSSPDLVNTDPRLAPFAHYGGPTATLALCTAAGIPDRSCSEPSPAIDAGDDAVTGPPDNLTTDQRGLPRKSGLHVDIGAYEVQPHDRMAVCVGDCNTDQQVSVDELLTLVTIALGTANITTCVAGDSNHDGQISVDEILNAVSNALHGCSGR